MKKIPYALATLALLALSTPALSGDTKAPETKTSEPKATDIVTFREAEMGVVGKHMKLAGMIYKGQIDRQGDLVAHATAIHDASLVFGDLFPASSSPDKVKTEAKAEIWKDTAGWQASVKGWQDSSAAWLAAVQKGDQTEAKAAFDKMGQSCGDCHDKFRVKD